MGGRPVHDQEQNDLPLRAERLRSAGPGLVFSVQVVVPDAPIFESSTTSTGMYNGTPNEASIRFYTPGSDQTFTVRTLVRLGEQMSAGHPGGVMTDAISIAALAARSLAIETLCEGVPREEIAAAVAAAHDEADSVAAVRASWTATPMVLDGVSYALWHRAYHGGFIAHADVGDSVIAAWGQRDFPVEMGHMKRITVTGLS
jgi:hypothetical protein